MRDDEERDEFLKKRKAEKEEPIEMKKRILPALLALCMVMSLLPATMLTASADEVTKCPDCGCSPICEECRAEEAEATAAPTPTPTAAATPAPTETQAVSDDPQQGVAAQAEGDEGEGSCPCKAGAPGTGHSCGSSCKFQICGVKECPNYEKYEDVTAVDHSNLSTGTVCNPHLGYCSKDKEAEDHDPEKCPAICTDVPGCTKGQGHKGTHKMTSICSNDERCGATSHVSTCPSEGAKASAAPAVTASPAPTAQATLVPGLAAVDTKRAAKTTVTIQRIMDAYFDCQCVNEAHDDPAPSAEPTAVACPNTADPDADPPKGIHRKFTVSIEVEVAYNYDVEYFKDEYKQYVVQNSAPVEDKDGTAANQKKAKADAEKKAEKDINPKSTDYDDAFEAELDKVKASYEALNKLYCEACAAHQDVVTCTMARDCPLITGHEANCLKLCTGNEKCPNDAGVATAHQVSYVIRKTTKASGDVEYEPGSYDAKSVAADAASALNAKAKADAGERNDPTYSYDVVAKYCPVAGIPDSVVVTADGEDVEEPTDTTDEAKVPEKAEDFADLKGDEWYAEELTELIEKGIFIGSKNAEGKYAFNSNGNVTLKEMVVLLSRVAGEDLVTTGDGGTWFVAALNWATEAGLVEGVEDGTLARKDVVLTLWRLAGSPEVEQDLADFEDAAELEGDYLAAMKWAVANEIIEGDGDTGLLKTDANITRAEMVAVLNRYTKLEK